MYAYMVYGFIGIKSNVRKLLRTNQGSSFYGGTFSNKDNVRTPILFIRESQPQYLKRQFSLKSRLIYFHINSTSVIRSVRQNQMSFSNIEINKPLPAPVHNVS